MTGIIRNFAVFEGGDGSGTTTQLSLLGRRFSASNPVFYPTFEPTEGPAGKLVRAALKKEITLLPETLARLFAADRTEHLYGPGGIAERCNSGELVVSDRYVLSSLVYQGIECGDELPRALNASFPAPELLLFFDVDPQIAQQRMQNRPQKEIYEYLEFQQKVREKYRSLLAEFSAAGVRVEIIDASKTPEEVALEVWSAVRKMPILGEGTPQ
ncbi:thymidylate kinase [Spirochaetia bacterium]|nr:thymidylate kinase [Spirochaetia bacterium]